MFGKIYILEQCKGGANHIDLETCFKKLTKSLPHPNSSITQLLHCTIVLNDRFRSVPLGLGGRAAVLAVQSKVTRRLPTREARNPLCSKLCSQLDIIMMIKFSKAPRIHDLG